MAIAALRMEPVWKGLPNDIVENKVLPLLPLESLCRFRAVSKQWNALITSPNFAAMHASTPPAEDLALISLRTGLEYNAYGGWDILNVANNKIFPLSDRFLEAQARPDSSDGKRKKVLATDGGLLLIWYSMAESSPDHVLLVCNPLLKVMKVLPPLPERVHAHHYDSVVMSTDRASMEYQIVVIHSMENHYQVECIDFFESKTGMWRRVINSTPIVPSEEKWLADSPLVKFKSRLYKLYRLESNMKPHLVEFNKTTGVSLVVPLPKPFLSVWFEMKVLELVVSQDRLFCLSKWRTVRYEYTRLEIFELFPERLDFKLLARMPTDDLKWLRGDDMTGLWDPKGVMYHYLDPIVATGCASSILFCSCMGRSVGYDLVSNSRRQYSASNLLKEHLGYHGFGKYLDCSNFGLSLCPP